MGVVHAIGGPDISCSTQSTFSSGYSQSWPLIKGQPRQPCLFHMILPSKMIVPETIRVWVGRKQRTSCSLFSGLHETSL